MEVTLMSDTERNQAINRAIIAAPLYIGLVYGATVVHELMHWLFIVPPGGSLSEWRLMPPGWDNVTLSGTFLDSIVYFAGGFGTAIVLLFILIAAVMKTSRANSLVWWWIGVAASFALPMQITAGIVEGALNDLYRGNIVVPIAYGVGIVGMIAYSKRLPFHWPQMPEPLNTKPGALPYSAIGHEQQKRENDQA